MGLENPPLARRGDIRVKVAASTETTHNPSEEPGWVSCLRENFTSSSDGEELETGPAASSGTAPVLTRHRKICSQSCMRWCARPSCMQRASNRSAPSWIAGSPRSRVRTTCSSRRTGSELVDGQLRPFADLSDGRVAIAGQPLTISAQATQHLALALHELATNACKHGTFSP